MYLFKFTKEILEKVLALPFSIVFIVDFEQGNVTWVFVYRIFSNLVRPLISADGHFFEI